MNDIHDDDFTDPGLGDALRALSPADHDVDAAYRNARPRFARARRNRRIAAAATGLVAVSAVAFGVIVIDRGADGIGKVRTAPAGPSRGSDPTATSGPDRTGSSTTTVPNPPPDSSSTSTPVVPPPTVPPASAPTSSSTTPAPPPSERTYTSEGGSIRVRIADRTVTLLSSAADPGYTADVRLAGPPQVEVRFREGTSGENDHRIRLYFDSAGTLHEEID